MSTRSPKIGRSGVTVDTKRWDAIKQRVEESQGPYIKVGVIGNGMTDDGKLSMADLARIHEFGSPAAGIPERSFLRRTFYEKRDEVQKIFKQVIDAMLNKKLPFVKAANIIGLWAATQVKNRITQGEHIPPPLQPATVKRKGSDRPLVDTGALVGSIGYEIVDK